MSLFDSLTFTVIDTSVSAAHSLVGKATLDISSAVLGKKYEHPDWLPLHNTLTGREVGQLHIQIHPIYEDDGSGGEYDLFSERVVDFPKDTSSFSPSPNGVEEDWLIL